MGPNSNYMFDRTVPDVIVKASFFDVLSVATIFDRTEDTVLEVGACIAVIFVELWPYLVIRSILLFPCWILNLLKENPLLVLSASVFDKQSTYGIAKFRAYCYNICHDRRPYCIWTKYIATTFQTESSYCKRLTCINTIFEDGSSISTLRHWS